MLRALHPARFCARRSLTAVWQIPKFLWSRDPRQGFIVSNNTNQIMRISWRKLEEL